MHTERKCTLGKTIQQNKLINRGYAARPLGRNSLTQLSNVKYIGEMKLGWDCQRKGRGEDVLDKGECV